MSGALRDLVHAWRGLRQSPVFLAAALWQEKRALELSQAALAAEALVSQRLALVAKYANDSVIFADAFGRIEWVNDAFTRISGYSFAEAVGQFPADLLNAAATDADTISRIAEARLARKPLRLEVLNRTKSGGAVWMETSIIPAIYDDAVADSRIQIATEDALEAARTLGRKGGILLGPSGGANLAAALRLGKDLVAQGREAVIATVFCDSGERYLGERFWQP